MADSGDGQRTVVKAASGSSVSRPLKTGRSFVLVVPDQRFVLLRWDKALYDAGQEAELTVEGRNLGKQPLEIRLEQQDEGGSWSLAGSLRADVEADGTRARSKWTVPDGIEGFRFKLRTTGGRELTSGIAAVKLAASDATPSARTTFEAAHFETDKAFPLPASISIFEAIAAFANQEPDRLLLVVGHTDAVGGDDANLVLSDERADAVSAYLRDDADPWMTFYQHPDGGKRWGIREDEHMLGALPRDAAPWYPLPASGKPNADLEKAFRAFQAAQGLGETGKANPDTRRALVLEYMKAKGATLPATSQVRTLGCGERHLLVPGSGAKAANRRVDVFAFAGTGIEPAPEECRKGKHPGCTVYARWQGAVTGPLESRAPLKEPAAKPRPAAPPKKRVLAVEGPKTFRLCEPAIFRVSKYEGSPTGADKDSRLRWFVRDGATGDDLLKADASAIQQKGETLEIDCVPFGWLGRTIEVGAQFDAPTPDKMFSGKAQSCELYDWIATIKKAEAEFPSLTGVQMTDAMRQIAGYDTNPFRQLYGGRPPATALKPHGALTQTDLDQLKKWTAHDLKGGVEEGILEDPEGNKVAAGHVLTGLSAGVYRERSIDLTPVYAVGVGERVDNLYAATISGDLGQVAIFVLQGKQAKPYMGSHGDATEAEVIGDIDGWLLGEAEPRGGSGKALSETLLGYYCGCKGPGTSFKKRYSAFSSKGLGNLEDQVIRFATNYSYLKMSKWDAANAKVEPDSKAAVAEFKTWLGKK
jgi:outer membrane protein OmpA-like peptidoglycan-associated protein